MINDEYVNDGRAPLTGEDLAAFQLEEHNFGSYGDSLEVLRSEENLRIVFLNVNGLQRDRWKEKNEALLKFFYRVH